MPNFRKKSRFDDGESPPVIDKYPDYTEKDLYTVCFELNEGESAFDARLRLKSQFKKKFVSWVNDLANIEKTRKLYAKVRR